VLKKWDVKVWFGFSWLKIWSSDGTVVNHWIPYKSGNFMAVNFFKRTHLLWGKLPNVSWESTVKSLGIL
jgi:hypothetical protein